MPLLQHPCSFARSAASVLLAGLATLATHAAAGLADAPAALITITPTPSSAATVQPLVMSGPAPGNAAAATARPVDSPLPADLETTLRSQLQQLALTSSQQALPGVNRVDIEVGQLDPRLHLAPCQRIEPYLPTGTRLWGKARIGLRCTQGQAAWNVYLPITVKVYGAAWVAAGTLAVGAVLGAGDLVQGEVDLAEESAPVVTDPDQAIGRTLLRRITAGQGLRATDLRPRQWFAAGDVVKLVASGPGFSVTGSGEAMNHGLEGQTVRVRIADTDGAGRPRIVTGQATGDRLVEVRP